MRRSKFALSICLILSVVIGLSVLSSCGGGGGSRPVTKPGDEVIITPPGNRAPVVSQAFENVVLPFAPDSQWESEPLGNYFSDPDDDTLRFGVDIDNSNVASVEVSDTGSLIVRARGSGAATITVTATDPDGLSAAESFTVTTTLDNRRPAVARVFENITLTLSDDPSSGHWASGYLDGYFSDPEGGQLTYQWQSGNDSVAVALADDSLQPTATMAGTPPGLVVEAKGAGNATISVTATDRHGATATQRFSVVVIDNRGVVEPPPADHSDTQAGAATIAFGQTVTGDFHSPNDVDWFRLAVTEPSVVDFQLSVPEGTRISIQDLNGNVLASKVAGSPVTTNFGGLVRSARVTPKQDEQVAVGFSLFLSRAILISLGVPPLTVAAVTTWTLYAAAAAVTLYVSHKLSTITVTPGLELSENLEEFFGCRLRREDNNLEYNIDEHCELELQAVSKQNIRVGSTTVGTFSASGTTVLIDMLCTADTVETTVSSEVRILGLKIPGFKWARPVTVPIPIKLNIGRADKEKCRPQKIPGGPELSITSSPGESVSITLTDYIWDPRDGVLTFTQRIVPPGVSIAENGANWTIRIAPDTTVRETAMTLIAVSTKDRNEIPAEFTFKISVGCEAQVVFNDHDIWTPSRAFTSALLQSEYTGDCKNGRANGQGTYVATGIGDSLRYEGEWEDGEPRGQGEWHIKRLLSERHYRGEWQDRRPHGRGTGSIEYFLGGTESYTGEWVDGLPHGRGTWTEQSAGDRYRYVGEFRNGLQHGRGVETNSYANGDRERLEGEFRNDVLWNGTSTWNGDSCRVVNGVWC